MATASPSNTPELSVSELSAALKRTVEDRFGLVRVRGEISNYRGQQASGHAYFSLKDATARLDAVIWKSTFSRLKTKPQEGLEVVATGKITTFAGKSSYQIVVETIEPAGIGALMALLEERRKMLAAEGLFDQARKKPLPFLPLRIGVVTSPTGSVIRDILHRIAERFPRSVLVWPVRVQGETSAAEVAAAIAGFNALPDQGPLRRPDLLIVARGGGSLEDLWSFNEEIVVRAVAASLLPLISAIGHETDWTLIDHAADLRAPTPTGAAEKAVPVRSELMVALADLERRRTAGAFRLLDRRRSELRGLIRGLPSGEAILALPRQRLDRAAAQLNGAWGKSLDRQRIALARLSHRLAQQSPQAKLARAGQRLESLEQRMRRSLDVSHERRAQKLDHVAVRLRRALGSRLGVERERVRGFRQRLATLDARRVRAEAVFLAAGTGKIRALSQLLNTLGYRQVLARGFALVRDAEARPLHFAADIPDGARIEIEFADGRKPAIAGDAPVATKRAAPRSKKDDQSSLF